MMSSKTVILGGTGFIGSAIARMSADSCTAIGSADCDLTDAEACAEKLPKLIKGKTVIYAAGIPRSLSDTPDTMQVNTAMVLNLVAAMRVAQPSGLIFLSTAELYGVPRRLPVTEQTEIRPTTFYAVGKYSAEQILRMSHHETGVPSAILRLPGIYGPGDRGRSVVGKLVECARNGQPFFLKGDGRWKRDYVWVDDIARVVTALSDTEFTELTLNVATGQSLSIREVIDQVSAMYGSVPLSAIEESGADGHLAFDAAKLRDALPGVELSGLAEGLKAYGE